jgi:LmbE family N-acetylglucosaminyl deacetylase
MSSESVVAVFAHPDDESLVAGGTLAACAAAGVDVVVVCATRGEQGPTAASGVAAGEALGRVRVAELRAASRELGASAVECLGYPDGELAGCDGAEVEADVLRIVRGRRAKAVVTFGPEGLYWHPDHVAVHSATTAAVEALRDEGVAPSLYYATWPKGHMTSLLASMDGRAPAVDAWGVPAEAFGADEDTITTVLDVRSQLEKKLRALACHRTQLSDRNVFRRLPPDLAERFLGREYFVRADAPPADGDWLVEAATRGGAGVVGVRLGT